MWWARISRGAFLGALGVLVWTAVQRHGHVIGVVVTLVFMYPALRAVVSVASARGSSRYLMRASLATCVFAWSLCVWLEIWQFPSSSQGPVLVGAVLVAAWMTLS